MAVYLIWLDDNGGEIKREQKGRGRGPAGFSKGEDGNWYAIASALEKAAEEKEAEAKAKAEAKAAKAEARAAKAKEPPQKKVHYLIWLDKDGQETKREPRTGRGRPPKDFTRRDDGNWYYEPPWRKRAKLAAEVATEDDEEPAEERIPRIHRVKAQKRTTPEAIARVCHVVNHEERDGVIVLSFPIVAGDTGLAELDEMDGQPLFHRIEIDSRAKTVSVWKVTSPGGPYLIVEDALAANMGETDAVIAG